jgi:SpoVK/Ycf46/Vps4 family AAA+-type ATPase
MTPRWLLGFEEARQSNTKGVIFVYNTNDLVHYPASGIPPCLFKFFVSQHLALEGYAVLGFSLAQGLHSLALPSQRQVQSTRGLPSLGVSNPGDLEQVLKALTSALRDRNQKTAVVFDYADHLAPGSQGTTAVLSPQHLIALETLHLWGSDDAIRATDNLIILISHENQLNELLLRSGSGYRVIQSDLPTEAEREGFIQLLLTLRTEGRANEFGVLTEDLTPTELARITGGLRLRDIEELLRLAAAQRVGLNRAMVRERKAEVIRQLAQNLLEVHEPTHGFEEVAAVRHAVEYFESLKWRIRAGDPGVPQAILLAGVPGCGKSFLVTALAKELGFPCLAMRNVRERWVGASERNLERVLWVAETLAPCLLWLEELDQVLGQRGRGSSTDAGTSERLLARIWEFMGSMKHRGRILWIATTNRPDLLDAATLDRFQVVIPFLHPTPEEVAELLPKLARQIGRELDRDVDARTFANVAQLREPTVRALQEVLAMAATLADLESGTVGSPIANRHLIEAALDFKPNYNPLLHQFIALTAINMTSFQSLLPWRKGRRKREGYEPPEYLKPFVDPETGEVAFRDLQNHLRRLQSELLTERVMQQV